MAGPWEQYATEEKPWSKYSQDKPEPTSGAGGGRGFVNPENVKEPLTPFERAIQTLRKLHGPRDLGAAAWSGVVNPALARFGGLLAGGVGAVIPGEEGQAEQWMKGTQQALTTDPTPEAQEIIGGVGNAVSTVLDKTNVKKNLKRVGEAVDAIGESAPVVGAALHAVPDLLALAGARAPLNAATRTASNALGKSLQSGAETQMIKALKPTIAELKSGAGQVAAKESLARGIGPNTAGVDALEQALADTNAQIAQTLAQSKKTIERTKAMRFIDDVRGRFANQAQMEPDLAAINKVASDFERNKPEVMTIQQAQAIKTGTNSILKKKYGQEGVASDEAQKAIVRGLKEEIAAAEPSIAGLNAIDSALYKTLPIVERRALQRLRSGNLGLAPLAHGPAGMVAYLADKSPGFRVLAARMMNASGKWLETTKPAPKASEFNPSLSRGFEPPAATAGTQSILGDLTPDWTTSLGVGGQRQQGISARGLFPAIDEPPLVPDLSLTDYKPSPMSGMPGIRLSKEPVLEGIVPDWTTSQGLNPRAEGINTAGLFRTIGDERVGTTRLKGRPQMPVQAGLLGVDDTAIAGQKWVDAAEGAPSRMREAPMAVGGIELSRIINMPKSAKRTKLLNEFKKRYPHAAQYIDEHMEAP